MSKNSKCKCEKINLIWIPIIGNVYILAFIKVLTVQMEFQIAKNKWNFFAISIFARIEETNSDFFMFLDINDF